jgi:hypothetical protein
MHSTSPRNDHESPPIRKLPKIQIEFADELRVRLLDPNGTHIQAI